MTALLAERLYTADDLLTLPDEGHFELLDGRLVEKHMGAEACLVAANVHTLIGAHVSSRRLGFVFSSDCGYQIYADHPDRVRRPDVSFIRRGRLPDDRPPRGHCRIAPDLAVEVVSPRDLAEEVNEKVMAYLAAGVRLVWLVFPQTQTVQAFRPDGTLTLSRPDGTLDGGDELPGFSCPVAEIFAGL